MVDKKSTKETLRWRLITLYFIGLLFSLNIALVGALLNMTAVAFNGGRMPVFLNNGSLINTSTHYSFSNKCKVNYFYFTDIIPLGYGMFSIGDILIFTSLGIALGSFIFVVLKWKKIQK